jgi:RNA polymerase sigma-70 factor (ECF subfamily)
MPAERWLVADEELLARLVKSDHQAFAELYNRYWEDAFNAAYARLKDLEQCRDIVQNVFLSVWDRREKVTIDNFRGYLLTAVKFQVFKYSSRNPHRSAFVDRFSELILSPVGADDQLLQKDILWLLEQFLDTLPRKRKEVFVLHLKHNLSADEIAVRLNISKKTVQNQLLNVNAAFRHRLNQLMILLILWLLNAK